jgi:hypothetical protein
MLRGCLFVGMVGGWTLSAASLYVVRSAHGVSVLTKNSLSFTDTYADLRQWKADDLPAHRDLVRRLMVTDHQDLLAGVPGVGGDEESADEEKSSSKHHKKSHSHRSDVALDE